MYGELHNCARVVDFNVRQAYRIRARYYSLLFLLRNTDGGLCDNRIPAARLAHNTRGKRKRSVGYRLVQKLVTHLMDILVCETYDGQP